MMKTVLNLNGSQHKTIAIAIIDDFSVATRQKMLAKTLGFKASALDH